MLSPSRWNASYSTLTNAPTDIVWESLSDIHSWDWNRWIRLFSGAAKTGATGKVRIATDGDKSKVRYYSFSFGKVSREDFTFEWRTRFGLCSCTNMIQLVPVGSKNTEIRHRLTFQGVLPACLGISWYKKIQSYSLCINEGLKNHVEFTHFNSLLFNMSAREMTPALMALSEEISVDSNTKVNFWGTSKELRKELVSTFIDDMLAPELVPFTPYDARNR